MKNIKKKEVYWSVYHREESYRDEVLIRHIQTGKIAGEDLISNKDLRVWLPVKETIYRFYLPEETQNILWKKVGEKDETIQ